MNAWQLQLRRVILAHRDGLMAKCDAQNEIHDIACQFMLDYNEMISFIKTIKG